VPTASPERCRVAEGGRGACLLPVETCLWLVRGGSLRHVCSELRHVTIVVPRVCRHRCAYSGPERRSRRHAAWIQGRSKSEPLRREEVSLHPKTSCLGRSGVTVGAVVLSGETASGSDAVHGSLRRKKIPARPNRTDRTRFTQNRRVTTTTHPWVRMGWMAGVAARRA
jgi:hypothetical protein